MTQTKEMNLKQEVKLQPLGDRILVRRLEAKETLKGGILLPDSAKKKQEEAEIIAIGTGKKDKQGNLIPWPAKVGDIVLAEKYSGQEVTLEEQEYVILKADDLIAIIKESC